MPIKDDLRAAVKVSRRTFFNPSKWFGYGFLINQIGATAGFIRNLLVPAQNLRSETFDQAMVRLGLSEQDIRRNNIIYLSYSAFFLIFSVGSGIYAFYLLIVHQSLSGLVLGLSVTGLALVNAFRFHFLSFQIRHRKLGCTIKEWVAGQTTEEGAP